MRKNSLPCVTAGHQLYLRLRCPLGTWDIRVSRRFRRIGELLELLLPASRLQGQDPSSQGWAYYYTQGNVVGAMVLGQSCWGKAVGPMLLGQSCWADAVGAKLLGQSCWADAVGAKLLGQSCWADAVGAKLLGQSCWGNAPLHLHVVSKQKGIIIVAFHQNDSAVIILLNIPPGAYSVSMTAR